MLNIKNQNGDWVKIPFLLSNINDTDIDKSLNRILPKNQMLKDVIDNQISDYLTANPFDTTEQIKDYISNQYVTPEMFGAVGDGVTDDTEAFVQACSKKNVLISKKYKITQPITLYKTVITANNNNAEIICAVDDDFAIVLNGYSDLRHLKISGKKCVKITLCRNKILHCNFVGDETIDDDIAITFNHSNWFGENFILNNYFNNFYRAIDCDNSEASITDNHINDNVFKYGTNSIVGTLAGCFICNNHDYSNEGMYLTVANCLIDGNYFDNKDHISLNIGIKNGSTSIKDNLFYSATENDTTCILIRDFNNARCVCTGNRTGGHKGTVTLFDLNNKWVKGDFRGNVCANLYKNVIWSTAQSSVGITMEGLFYFNNEEYTLPINIVGNVVSVKINSTGTFDVGKIGRLEWTYISGHDIYTPCEYENGIGTAIFRANGDVEIYNSNSDVQMKNIKIAVDIPMKHTEISY